MCTDLSVKISRESKSSEHPVTVCAYLLELCQVLIVSTREKSCHSSAVKEEKALFWKHDIVFCSSYQGLPSGETNQS